MKREEIEERALRVLMVVATLTVLCCLVLILAAVFIRGLPAMDLDMVTKCPKGGYYLGKEGGVLNAIVGSVLLAGGATIMSILLALPVAMYFNVYARRGSKLVHFARISLDVLWGVPSIVYGAFGFTIMLFLGIKASLLGGIITVALLIFPIMSRAMDEVLQMVPRELLDSSYSLGATRLETAFKVVTRQTAPGLLSAILIAFGRGIGDAASVIFTAGFSDSIPFSLTEPAATLPLAIFFQLGTPFPQVQERAYASALILTIIVLGISILSRVLTRRHSRHITR